MPAALRVWFCLREDRPMFAGSRDLRQSRSCDAR